MTRDLTQSFGTLYEPFKAIIIYKKDSHDHGDKDFYVESYDMDRQGRPINGHPLTVRESAAFAKSLAAADRRSGGFLVPQSLLPKNVLYVNYSGEPFALWYTPAQERNLLFSEHLGLPCGTACVPPLLWKAGRSSLHVFALQTDAPEADTPLCHAPLFNIYAEGRVCMGNVQVRIPAGCALEQFMALWEDYFFNSYFSHLAQSVSAVKGNIIQLWQHLLTTREAFPTDLLIPNGKTIQHLIS